MNRRLHQHALDMLHDTLAPIAPLVEDPAVQEVMVNRADDVWVERAGRLFASPVRLREESIRAAVRIVAALGGREVSDRGREALLDGRLPGLRIAAALPPVAVMGPALCIRRHGRQRLPLSAWATPQDQPVACAADVPEAPAGDVGALLGTAVRARRNILVSGATGSGKTTLLNALLAEVPADERLVTIEDTAELQPPCPNRVAFEAAAGSGVDMRDLVRHALRFRPDRIVVGEVRGGEAFDLLQALSTGHDGGMATLHAGDPPTALTRLEQLVLQSGTGWPFDAVRRHIATTIHLVVQVGRRNGRRYLEQVVALQGWDQGRYRCVSLHPVPGTARLRAAPSCTVSNHPGSLP